MGQPGLRPFAGKPLMASNRPGENEEQERTVQPEQDDEPERPLIVLDHGAICEDAVFFF
jgi:hypothetical protein